MRGENPGTVADEDYGTWYREMFSPGVAAGLLRPADLAGYRVYHGLSAGQLDDVVEIMGGDSTSHTFNGLSSGTHYFAVAAVNSAGMEGARSGVGSKTIP